MRESPRIQMTNSIIDGIQRGKAGVGLIKAQQVSGVTQISLMHYTYPLRLIKPRSFIHNHQAVYMINFGGGLVSGDSIELAIDVQQNCRLSLLTQSSTKVYKRKSHSIPVASKSLYGTQDRQDVSMQFVSATIGRNALLALIPEPVTCFKDALYTQQQRFNLTLDASLILLDWYSSGRASRGESWQFDMFMSHNEVMVDGKLVFRDTVLLEDEHQDGSLVKSYAVRMGVYTCYATLVFVGQLCVELIKDALESSTPQLIKRTRLSGVDELVWSASSIMDGKGAVVRAAAIDVDTMRAFIHDRLRHSHGLIGTLFS